MESFPPTITICHPKKHFLNSSAHATPFDPSSPPWCSRIQHPFEDTILRKDFQLEKEMISLWRSFENGVVFKWENDAFTIRRKMSRKQVMLFRELKKPYDMCMRSTGCLGGVTEFLLKSFSWFATEFDKRVFRNLLNFS